MHKYNENTKLFTSTTYVVITVTCSIFQPHKSVLPEVIQVILYKEIIYSKHCKELNLQRVKSEFRGLR